MYRVITEKLLEWKNNKEKKPLMITGVRQCGKTYVLKELGEKYFENTCYINFEADSKYSQLFDYDLDVKRIVKELEILEKTTITPGKTLLILDEIQECPRAITSLKYFCENIPDLHVASAGSLLGVALKKENISFPVGKVTRLQMYPMNFKEFMLAMGEQDYVSLFSEWNTDHEIIDAYRKQLEKLLKTYYAVGGMPGIVSEYIHSDNYEKIIKLQEDMLEDYGDDFSKHAPVSELEKIRYIWSSIPKQLAKDNNKFMFSHVKEGKRAHELEGSLQWLKNSGLIQILEKTENAQIPLEMNADATYFKVYMSDIGLLSRRLNLTLNDFLNDEALGTFKGAVVENYVMNELISQGKAPYYWRSGNTAELDFIFEHKGKVIPLEVKAADNTMAKSYRLYCQRYRPVIGLKTSLKNIAENMTDQTKTISLPLYLLWNIDRYIR